MELLFLYKMCFITSLCLWPAFADPISCTRGFQLASKFHKCWEEATFNEKYPPLHKPQRVFDRTFMEDYASHMCSVVKPQALKCLSKEVEECSNSAKINAIADDSGGACKGDKLNPFFKEHVIKHLVPVKGDSPCFKLGDNSYECYTAAGQKVMRSGDQSDNIVTFHRVADKFFNAYWECMVTIYKSNLKACPHWQIPMLLELQKTAMPSLFGLRLKPEQVKKLELENNFNASDQASKGKTEIPEKLYLLIQLQKAKPDVKDLEAEESIVLELSDLGEETPRLKMETEKGAVSGVGEENHTAFTLKEIKELLREQRLRNKELKEFINQAKGLMKNGKKTKKNKNGMRDRQGVRRWKKKTKGVSQKKMKAVEDRMID